MMLRTALGIALAAIVIAAIGQTYLMPVAASGDPLVARGKYLVVIGACNDCHTPGWRDSDGSLAVGKWMVGSNVGLRDAWGTSYPANVRIYFSHITEGEWLAEVRTRGGRMQWHDLRNLTTPDQRSIYRFIRSLGPKGSLTPDDVPPDLDPQTPYIDLRLHTPAPARR
jgi:mono/diheme cytochrome c family protein